MDNRQGYNVHLPVDCDIGEQNFSDSDKNYHAVYDQTLPPQMSVSVSEGIFLKSRPRIQYSPLSLYPPQNNREHKDLH